MIFKIYYIAVQKIFNVLHMLTGTDETQIMTHKFLALNRAMSSILYRVQSNFLRHGLLKLFIKPKLNCSTICFFILFEITYRNNRKQNDGSNVYYQYCVNHGSISTDNTHCNVWTNDKRYLCTHELYC